MATYVLVAGQWHGGWCWKKVAPLLRAAGHEVYAPTLTGLGERTHLVPPDPALETHITDVANVLVYEDLREVILVGHSYAGVVIAGVADRAPERLAHLVYLDAFAPHDGESATDLMRQSDAAAAFPADDPPPIATWGVTDPADVAWAQPRLAPRPGAHAPPVPVRLRRPDAVAALPRSYIRCARVVFPGLDISAARARAEPGWRYRELDSDHDPMITHPRALADLLLEVAPAARPA